MSARAAFAVALAAVLALGAVPWAESPLRRLAGGAGDGPDPTFDVFLDAGDLRRAADVVGEEPYATASDGPPLVQGNLKAAGQLYLAPALPVLDVRRARWIVRDDEGDVVVARVR